MCSIMLFKVLLVDDIYFNIKFLSIVLFTIDISIDLNVHSILEILMYTFIFLEYLVIVNVKYKDLQIVVFNRCFILLFTLMYMMSLAFIAEKFFI